jgi:thymidine kinase
MSQYILSKSESNQRMKEVGYLELIIGPMYAGKSTELIRSVNRYKCLGKNIVVINHKLNNRYGSSQLTTHNKEKIDHCIILEKLKELNDDLLNKADVIIIEELQFFEDAFDMVKKWCDENKKTVIAAGLDGDFMRQSFGDVLKLIPHAEKVTKLSALCKRCGDGTLAHFSKRITKEDKITLIGSNEIYEAVCRKHFLEL